ncbi:membrane protein containing DUF389 [Rhodopirellula maiorica SM1]|uniref:Membrane protein containing DUF389 n=1 Tax=Rhodopirellula maiorica SM1 TaxID=1265738 RepID=M5S0Y6_9BACT|nr:DUF389 domain-containing protein [Rhodopirellula maiorica]EMI19819.1 membrane protein containing DUF389 [Rhodopirellula maiorica SM1]
MLHFPSVSTARTRQIVREISHASKPRERFFVMLIVASMIASFGLIANSTAVIIGAMLVSPLMTPIFGIALGMLRGSPRLLLTALSCEALGVVLAVASAYLVGLPQISLVEATPEMLPALHPNLLDLLVAVFAGFAGAYALLDERVSPALPGVAIATAIVPPLSTCGLCLSLGAWAAASGAMLLFLANFVAILVVALLTFWVGGLVPSRPQSTRQMMLHFGPTAVAFIVITVVLTNALLRINRARTVERGIYFTLTQRLADIHGADLEAVNHKLDRDGVEVLATVRSHDTISPVWVSAMQAALQDSLSLPVELVVRTIRSQDVSPVGTSLQVVRPNLDGQFLVPAPESFAGKEAFASQVLREIFEREPGVELTRLEYGRSSLNESVVVAYVDALRRLRPNEIKSIEQQLQTRFDDPSLRFFARVNSTALQDSEGVVRVEWSNVSEAGPEEIIRLPDLRATIQATVEKTLDVIAIHTHFNCRDGHWQALVEVIGAREIRNEDFAMVQQALPESCPEDLEILIWLRHDYVVTQGGLTTYDRITDPYIQEQSRRFREWFQTETIPSANPQLVVGTDNQ